MRTLQQWFDEYSESHQNPKNKTIHYLCVPAIFLSIVGLLQSIPNDFLVKTFNLKLPFVESWAFIVLILTLVFYYRLSFLLGIKMMFFAGLCLLINLYVQKFVSLWIFSSTIFVLAWIGQFYGHKIEGKKPSFLKDLQFLLIGPAWVIENLFKKN